MSYITWIKESVSLIVQMICLSRINDLAVDFLNQCLQDPSAAQKISEFINDVFANHDDHGQNNDPQNDHGTTLIRLSFSTLVDLLVADPSHPSPNDEYAAH